MPILAAFAFANLKRDLGALVGWLSHRSFWQLVSMGLCALLLVQHFQLVGARHTAAKWQKQYTELHQKLDSAIDEITKNDKQIAQLAKLLKEANDEQNTRIIADAMSLRVSGPGKSACRSQPSAASGGPVASSAKPNASGPALPPDDSAAVPWGWLVTRGQEHDQLRTEVQTWHDWYAMLVKNWPKNNVQTK